MTRNDDEFKIRVLPKMWRGNDVPVSPEILQKGIRIPGAKYDPRQDLRRALGWITSPSEPPEGDC